MFRPNSAIAPAWGSCLQFTFDLNVADIVVLCLTYHSPQPSSYYLVPPQLSMAMPDVHSGYGFAIGNVAAFDMADPEAVVSPGGVGFDINCGVRLLRTNLVRLPLTSEIVAAVYSL